MGFENFLREQLKKHSSMQPQDVVKMCYQAAHGAEHLLADFEKAKEFLQNEYEGVEVSEEVLYETISENICRINLSAWKAKGWPIEWLFRMFAASCRNNQDAGEQLNLKLKKAEEVLRSLEPEFTMQEWEDYVREYQKEGMPAVHHSPQYRKKEQPAYRIVNRRFCRIFPILEKAKEYLDSEEVCVISIDGRAACGKTTLAGDLKCVLEGEVIHMDDFFVPPHLRTQERFQTPGRNVHHERFCEEVLPFVGKREPFSYGIFDCGRMDYHGKREIGTQLFRVVEGSYSCHPIFGSYADISVFLSVSLEEQRERIRNRNGEEMLARFLERWIPMEEEYFNCYNIREKCDIKET